MGTIEMAEPAMSLVALGIPLMGFAALALMRAAWSTTNHSPVRPRRHLTGRRATVYWYSPTGLQDERGITARRVAAAAAAAAAAALPAHS
ncbi:MAG: hypothetical protein ACT4QG_08810 [Sporichthyaceae bacterium]